jgi:hypothetical protein
MKNSSFTIEHALYALALAVALTVRVVNLGALPLSDFEAGWALQALHVSQGLRPALGPNPAYLNLTALLFYVFGATDFLARFWPALAGSVLACLPFFFRDRLGRIPALILAFGLAIDPGLAAVSRLAGGSMLAIAFLALTLTAWMKGRRSLAGVFAGLALLAGPSVWFGLLTLLLTLALNRLVQGKTPTYAADGTPLEVPSAPAPGRLRWADLGGPLAWALGVMLTVGSLLLFSPKGIVAFFASLGSFVAGWWTVSDVPVLHVLISLPVYELLPLVFGIVAVVRGILKRDRLTIGLGLWALAALLLALIYPGKQVADLAWASVPLWTLAALELGRHFDLGGRNTWELAGIIGLVIALLVFGWLDLASVTTMDIASNDARVRLYLVLAVALLVGLSLLLVGSSWSVDMARLGGVWGGLIFLTAYTVSVMTGTIELRQPLTEDFWLPGPRTIGADLILKVAGQVADWNRGTVASLPLTVAGVDSPALLWTFRDWQVQSVAELGASDAPALVITPSTVELSQSQGYRGEGFAWRETASWSTTGPADWLRWFLYHQAPVGHDTVVLWVRGDLVIENQSQPSTP